MPILGVARGKKSHGDVLSGGKNCPVYFHPQLLMTKDYSGKFHTFLHNVVLSPGNVLAIMFSCIG